MAQYLDITGVKQHLRVDFNDDDSYITGLMDMVEEIVLTEIQGSYPGGGTVVVAGTSALVGVSTSFTDYTAGDTISVSGETIKTIATITDDTHLTVSGSFTNSASGLTYVMHPGIPSPIPKGLKHSMMLMAGHFYMNREPVIIGVGVNKMPYAYEYLIGPYKNWTLV